MTSIKTVIAVVAFSLASAAPAFAQTSDAGPLGQVKTLYESAEYDSALAALDAAAKQPITSAGAHEQALYRILCLLALDRNDEAQTAAAKIIEDDPLFDPGKDQSPRLRALIGDVRQRTLPHIVEAHYREGKARYDRGEFSGASAEFTLALAVLDASGDAKSSAALDDIKTLAEGFRELAKEKVGASAARGPIVPLPTPSSQPRPVTDAVPVRQDVPKPPEYVAKLLRQRGQQVTGVLEVHIDEQGDVPLAQMIQGVHPIYDALILDAAKHWKYEPAKVNGQPQAVVKRLVLNIDLK